MVLEEQEDIVVARISVRCFRLLALVSEVQNEVEVVKPILQELEVMRLSCALGMLANVNAKDFEHDMLEASEFDDDFARFLRQELFGGRNGDDDASASHHVSVTSAFGKQSEVKYHLQKLNAWDDDMERHLRERDQGIYAVLLPDDTMSDEVASPKLVLFGWLVDCLFEPEHLRDTPTYILRFLTCLSSNVTCCLSTKDCLSLQAVVSAMDSSDMDDWKSYSVGFRVELAEDEKDSVRVNSVRSMELPTVNGARQMRVIKGSFPGLAAVADVRREKAEFTSRLTFKDALALSNWLVERSTTSQVHVDSSQLDMKIREAVIVASNMWPDSKLEEIDIQYNAELVQAEEAAKMEIERVVSEEQVALMEAAKVLFCVDVLEDHKRTQEALDVVQTSLEALASVNTVLEAARDRFQEAYCVLVHVIREMRPTMVLFMAGLEDELCTSLQKPPNLYALSKAKNKWQNLRASLKSMCDGTPVGRGFRDRMMTPLETMREGWWASVAAILDVYRQKSLPFLVDKRSREVAISRENAARAAVDDAFQDLIGEWSRPHDSGSSLKIDARCRKGKIICACKEMTWVPQGERMLVWKLCSDKEPSSADALSMLGEFRLHGGETVMGVFSVQHTSLIVVSTSADRCFLRRVQFPLDPNVSKRRNRIVATEIRSFTRDVVLCDFSVENRMLALMDRNNNVGLLRFDEKFTFLEQTKTINVDERTSLVIPVVSIAVSDGMLYALDCEGSMQSVNLRSMQTSKKRCDKTLCSREDKWQSDLFFLQGEAVLGSLEATRHERDAVGKLHVMSIDDYRLLPEVEGASIKLAATEQLSAYVQGESLYVLDGCQLHIVAIHATIRSSSFRMQSDCANVDDDASQQTKLSSHWLWALYHLYEKFPVSGLLEVCCGGPMAKERTPMKLTVVIPAGDAQAAQDFVRVVMENLQKLNKPLYGLGLSGNLTVKQTSSCSGDFFSTTTTAGFLERMVTIVPIQICRAEYNSLTVMQNGQDQPDDFVDGLSNEHQSTEIAQSIRFGLLSPLLQSWGGQCVVITSMGKQSTGKSYFLNHLTGSSFAIAGARCTDGAWMCVRVLSNDVLLVVIDFEGLGSFERTEQEDVFLSVLNASISMLTVFRMEMRFDKEIDDLFSKFQKGSRLIKNDPLLFRGKLYMSVKDVNPNDQREIVREIVTKFRRLMDVNKEHSFLTDMYTGQLEVNCSPPLGTSGYYRSLTQVQRFIETRLCGNSNGGFLTGKAFLDCIRLVLAKISILDWTSMSESAFKLKISTMRAQLPGIVRFGTITSISNTTNDARVADMEELVDPTSGDVVSVAREEVYASQPSMQAAWTSMVIAKLTDKLDDSAIDLGILTCGTDSDRRNAVSLTIERLFRRFLQLQTGTSDASVTGTVQKEFDAFLAYVICRRRLRIQKWAKSKIGDQDSSEWKSVEKQQFIPLQSIGRCLGRCAHCYLGCMKAFGHLVDGHGHDCGTTHLCSSVCAYCAEENCVNVCAKKAGHEDRCECDAEDHTCGAPCSLRGAPNCGGGCAEKSGHDSDHRCSVGKHRCGQPCFVNNCEGRCVLDVELPHAEHRCESDRCVQSCGFEGCDRLCCSSDHLHGQGYHESAMSASQAISESVVAHLCGEEHECAELCDEDGICDLRVSQKHVLKTFAGARDTFRFTLQEMEGVRKKCTKSLPPGERLHLGSHSCAHQDEDKVHFCESRCPCCAYHCTKHQGHQGKHRTTHGNMRETLFVSDNHQIDFLDRKYQAGERGVAEMCNLFCSGAGRGHVHFLECEHRNALICQLTSGSKRRHCVKILEPPPSRAMDELLHEEFWGTLGWQDPCSSISERDSFKKCAYKCDSTEHDRDHASYCILPAWHTSELTPEANERDGFSYLDGHKFECQHAASGKRMHHVFVLDCSGSMRGQPWFKLMEAFHEYVNNRISAGASQDVMSVLTFSRTVEIVYEARDIMKMRDANVPFRGGETWYSEGLRGAHEVLSRMDSAKFTPVLVIFSDGRPHDPKRVDELGRRIRHSYERVGLQAFMVGAGRANLSYLQRLAQLMGGRYLHALHNTELKNQFQKISASVGAKMSLAVASRW